MSANFTDDSPCWQFTSSKTKDELRECISEMQQKITEQEEKIKEMRHEMVTLSLAKEKLALRYSHARGDCQMAYQDRDLETQKRWDVESKLKEQMRDADLKIRLRDRDIVELRATIAELRSKILQLGAENAQLQASIAERDSMHGLVQNSDHPAETIPSDRNHV